MSVAIDSRIICLEVNDETKYATISFDILSKEIYFDLDMEKLKRPNLITYFIRDKNWGAFAEGVWHHLPMNLISYIASIYSNNLPKGVKFIYG